MAEITLTPDSEVQKSSLPVLVDFWATWCGPCQMLAPILEEFANENDGKIKVGKVNVDEARELAMDYRISSIPTLILFENGEAKKMTLGLQTKEKLQEFIS